MAKSRASKYRKDPNPSKRSGNPAARQQRAQGAGSKNFNKSSDHHKSLKGGGANDTSKKKR